MTAWSHCGEAVPEYDLGRTRAGTIVAFQAALTMLDDDGRESEVICTPCMTKTEKAEAWEGVCRAVAEAFA